MNRSVYVAALRRELAEQEARPEDPAAKVRAEEVRAELAHFAEAPADAPVEAATVPGPLAAARRRPKTES